jgi:hypothetical protein
MRGKAWQKIFLEYHKGKIVCSAERIPAHSQLSVITNSNFCKAGRNFVPVTGDDSFFTASFLGL